MPIDASSLLLQLRPPSPIDLSPLRQLQQMGQDRQNLALMRQKFEEEKRANRENERLRALSEAGEARRAEMAAENQRQRLAAEAEAQRVTSATGAYNDFLKATDARDHAGMETAAARLREYGGVAEQLGADEEGRPKYRVGLDGKKRNEQVQQRDAVTKDLSTNAPEGSVWLPPDVSQQRVLSRLNTLGLGNLDNEGVVDAGKLADASRRQTEPLLEAQRNALPPGAYRDSAVERHKGLNRLGLNPLDTYKLDLQLGKPSDDAISGTVDDLRDDDKLELDQDKHALDREKFEWEKSKTGADKPLNPLEEQRLEDYGAKKAEKAYNNRIVKLRVGVIEAAEDARKLLTDDDPNNDEKAVNRLMKLGENIGHQSDADAMRVTGEGKASYVQRIQTWLNSIVTGGYDENLRKSMAEYVDRLKTDNVREIHGYISDMETESAKEKHDLVRRGYEGFVERNVPSWVLKEYDEATKDAEPAPGADPEKSTEEGGAEQTGSVQIPETSRIAFEHNNPGNLKFVDQEGAERGEEASGGGHWARFASVEAGLNALRDQVMRDAERGLSIRDFIMKYAPPTDGNDTERYIEEAVRALKAESSEDALAETDPYDVVRFVAKKESSTVLPDQYTPEPGETKPAGKKGADDAELDALE